MLIYSMLTLAAAFPPLSFLSGRFVTFPVALASFCDRGWGSGVRRRPAAGRVRSGRRSSTVAQYSPEQHQVTVEVVDGLQADRRLCQQHSQTAGERLDVLGVLRQHCCDARGQADFPAVVDERRHQRRRHAGTRSSSPASQQIAVWGEMRWCRAITATS